MKRETMTNVIKYSRTVVPSTMRSPYWKYFGFPSDNDNNILTRQKIVCTLCNAIIAYNKNTSNLRTHLISRHCDILHQLHEQSSVRRGQSRRHGHEQRCAISEEMWSLGDSLEKHCDKAVDTLYFITNSVGVKSTIKMEDKSEDEDGDDLVERVPSPTDDVSIVVYSGPSQAEGYEVCEREALNTNLGDSLSEANSISNNDLYTTRTPKQQRMKAKRDNDLTGSVCDMLVTDLLPLSVVEGAGFTRLMSSECGNVNAAMVEARLAAMYKEMSTAIAAELRDHLQGRPYSLSVEFSATIDGMTVMCVYVNCKHDDGHKLWSILYHVTVVVDTIDEKGAVDFETILQGFNLSNCSVVVVNAANPVVDEFFKSHKIPVVPCMDTTLKRCMTLVFNLPGVQKDFRAICDGAKNYRNTLIEMNALPDVYPQCPWSKLNLLRFCCEDNSYISLTDDDVLERMRILSNYLRPLRVALDTIAEEPLPLCSLVCPLARKLLDEHFSADTTDGILGEVKQIIVAEISSSVLEMAFFSEAAYFDPRFRQDFVEAMQSEAIRESTCKRFPTFISLAEREKATPVGAHDTVKEFREKGKKSSSLKSFLRRKSSDRNDSESSFCVAHEFTRYNCEPPLDLEQSPIVWWQRRADVYRQLSHIADYYLCAMCCVNRLFRCDIKKRIDLDNRRLALRNEAAQQIWYLHYNRKFYNKITLKQ